MTTSGGKAAGNDEGGMMRIATLVGSDGLSAGDAAAASDVVRALGGEPGVSGWLEPGIAATLAFFGAESGPVRDALEAAFPAADVFVRPAAAVWRLFVADMDSTMITV